MTTTTNLHDDPTISAFLADGGYDSIEAWALDSDFRYSDVSCEWYSIDDAGPWANPVDIEGAIEGAIEACGFGAPVESAIDRYAVNDALSALADGRLSDDVLNDLTHLVADAIDQA